MLLGVAFPPVLRLFGEQRSSVEGARRYSKKLDQHVTHPQVLRLVP